MSERKVWHCEFCGTEVTGATGRPVCVPIPDPHEPGKTAHGWLAHFDLPEDVAYWLGSTLMAAQNVSDHYAKGDYEGLPPDLESFDDLARSFEGLGLALGRGGWAKPTQEDARGG